VFCIECVLYRMCSLWKIEVRNVLVLLHTEAKETYYRGKRDLLQRQKRPTTEAKETYYRGKRDLLHTGTDGSGCHRPSNLRCAVAPPEQDCVCVCVGMRYSRLCGGYHCVAQAKEEEEEEEEEEEGRRYYAP
jgi:hypothetical protein